MCKTQSNDLEGQIGPRADVTPNKEGSNAKNF